MVKDLNGIIAFCGAKGAGKDTSYEVLAKDILPNTPIQRIGLADHLKVVCAKVFGLDPKYFNTPNLKELDLEEETVYIDSDHLVEILELFNIQDTNPFDSFALRKHMGKICTTPRQVLQYVGTNILHTIDPLIHVKLAIALKDPTKLTAITDLRFEQEFNYFYHNVAQFTPVYVKNAKAEAVAASDQHPSERQLDKFKNKCYLLINDGNNMEALKTNLTGLVKTAYGVPA